MRRLDLPSPVKLVGSYCAQYGNLDGRDIFPGVDRLSLETNLCDAAVRRALKRLREIGMLVRVTSGSAQGRRGKADEYRLAIPDDILDRVELVSETSMRHKTKSPVPGTGNAGSGTPVPGTGDAGSGTPVPGTANEPEHRYVSTGTPVPGTAHQPTDQPRNMTSPNSGDLCANVTVDGSTGRDEDLSTEGCGNPRCHGGLIRVGISFVKCRDCVQVA